MKKSELLKQWGIELPENFEDGEFDYLPKQRFDEVNNSKKELENSYNKLKTDFERLGETGAKYDDLKKQFDEMTEKMKKDEADYQQRLQEVTIKSSIKERLSKEKARDNDIVMKLINYENIKTSDNGILGLDEEIKRIKDSAGYLFDNSSNMNSPEPGLPTGTNANSGDLNSWDWINKATPEQLAEAMKNKQK